MYRDAQGSQMEQPRVWARPRRQPRWIRRHHLALSTGGLGAAGAALATACGAGSGAATTQVPATGCASRIEYFCRLRTDQGVNPFILPAYAAASPKCTLEVVTIPSTDLPAKLLAAVVGGTPPAVVDLPTGNSKQLQAKSLLAPVDDLFKRDKLTKDDFSRGLWEQMSFNGRLWFMPGQQTNADFVLFWNKALFRESGLDPEKGPTTIAELESLLPKLTRDTRGEYERVGMVPWDLYGHGNTIQAWGRAFGGDFYDPKKDEMT